jgi:hypothetical protein
MKKMKIQRVHSKQESRSKSAAVKGTGRSRGSAAEVRVGRNCTKHVQALIAGQTLASGRGWRLGSRISFVVLGSESAALERRRNFKGLCRSSQSICIEEALEATRQTAASLTPVPLPCSTQPQLPEVPAGGSRVANTCLHCDEGILIILPELLEERRRGCPREVNGKGGGGRV